MVHLQGVENAWPRARSARRHAATMHQHLGDVDEAGHEGPRGEHPLDALEWIELVEIGLDRMPGEEKPNLPIERDQPAMKTRIRIGTSAHITDRAAADACGISSNARTGPRASKPACMMLSRRCTDARTEHAQGDQPDQHDDRWREVLAFRHLPLVARFLASSRGGCFGFFAVFARHGSTFTGHQLVPVLDQSSDN
jgi:hypothetical protein